MKCTITYYDAGSQRVEFASAYGDASAFWTGTAVEPGTEVEAELGLSESLVWDLDAIVIEPEDAADIAVQSAIRMDKGRVVLTGSFAGEGPDGEGLLRIGEEEVEFEALGEAPRLGSLVQLRTKQLVLYPW